VPVAIELIRHRRHRPAAEDADGTMSRELAETRQENV
jgi:hypothetical protein